MAQNDDFDFDNFDADSGDGIKSLRKAYNTLKQQLADAQSEVQTFRAEKRSASVASVLKSKGLPEGAAALFAGDDVSEEKVSEWADGLAAMFGIQSAATTDTADEPETGAAAAQSRMDAAQSAGRTPEKLVEVNNALLSATSEADLLRIIQSAQ